MTKKGVDPQTIFTATVNPSPAFDLSAFKGRKPAAVFSTLTEDHLSDGIRNDDNPLDPQNVVDASEERKGNPVTALMALRDKGANLETLLGAMNETYAVVRYGNDILVASTIGNDISFMDEQNFHKMLANLIVFPSPIEIALQNMKKRIEDIGQSIISMTIEDFRETFADLIVAGEKPIKVSRYWFNSRDRRYYLSPGAVFEPGGSLEIPNDMINLWRGFGIQSVQGDWSLLRDHILNVICSGQHEHFDYFIKWMAYAVQRPNEPIGVAVALRGAQGTGKGIVARTFGKFFGKHFAHIANGDQLTGRFNASLGQSCAVFLDEAVWAGDKKAEGVLKALITEPKLQLEAKFRDPIMVDNRLRIMVASNNDWVIPTGIGDRRWFVLDVANNYAGTGHREYWTTLYAEIDNGGAEAMFYDLLAIDLRGFDVRAVPHTAAKAQQQTLSFNGTTAWLHHVLQEGAIGSENWQNNGLAVGKDQAYQCYEDFSNRQREWRPEIKAVWSKNIRNILVTCVADKRETAASRPRLFNFAPLANCRRQFETHVGAPNIEWAELHDACQAKSVSIMQSENKKSNGLAEKTPLHSVPTADWLERATAQAAADLKTVRNNT